MMLQKIGLITFLILPLNVLCNQVYIKKSLCNSFIGQMNRKLINTRGERKTPNIEWNDCIQSCINDNGCTSVEYNKITKECTKKDYGSYGQGTTEQVNSLYYTKILNPGCESWDQIEDNHYIESCGPCILSELPITNLETCEEKCQEHSGCYSINMASSCHLLSSVSIIGAMPRNSAVTNSRKPMCLTQFNVSTENICSTYSEEKLIDSIGDGLLECPTDKMNIPINGIIQYTTRNVITFPIQVTVYMLNNDNKCLNIAVSNDPNSKSILCKLMETQFNFCKFECFGKDYSQLTVHSLSNENAYCEIQISSEEKLVNICM